MANQFSNTVKFLRAVSLLASPDGTNIRELMYHLGISRRSIFRLLNALEELGFPIADSQPNSKAEKTYRLPRSYVLKLPNIAIPNPCLTSEEIMYILAILDKHKRFKSLSETPTYNSARKKLAAMIQAGKKG